MANYDRLLARRNALLDLVLAMNRLPPPDLERPTSFGREGNSVATSSFDEPTYKSRPGYKDAPGGKIYSGQLSYDLRRGRRKI